MHRISKIKLFLFLIITLISGFPAKLSSQDVSTALKTVCIDAGHGGKDPGCLGANRVKEKNLTLAIAKELARMIRTAHPDVNVVMTREDDSFVGLAQRASIAHKANADLFISIHIDAADSGHGNGFTVYCMGKSSSKYKDLFAENMKVCKRENSVITYEDDYQTRYKDLDMDDPLSNAFYSLSSAARLEQSLLFASYVSEEMSRNSPVRNNRGVRQAGFVVLFLTSMPSVLIECGYISNSSDRDAMNSAKGQKQIASCISAAFDKFKKDYDSIAASTGAVPIDEAGNEAGDSVAGEVLYGSQVLASGKQMRAGDKFFKGRSFTAMKSGNIYKYIVNTVSSEAEARRNHASIKKDFPDAFLVKIYDGKVERLK